MVGQSALLRDFHLPDISLSDEDDLRLRDLSLPGVSLSDEDDLRRDLVSRVSFSDSERLRIDGLSRYLTRCVRSGRRHARGIDAFMHEYSLSSEEGIVLMCLAESLLRIPDSATVDSLIADKIGGRRWKDYIGQSDSLFVNASSWGLMLTGHIVDESRSVSSWGSLFHSLVRRSGEPIIRRAMRHAMRILGRQFILGETIGTALAESCRKENASYRFSFDMLGEAAKTISDSDRYYNAYFEAIEEIGGFFSDGGDLTDVYSRPSISIKLSALHPRFEESQHDRIISELLPRVRELALLARDQSVGLTIDAEEMERRDLQLEIFSRLVHESCFDDWNGFGLAVQAYSGDSVRVLEYLRSVGRLSGHRLPIRLVKGAYWDTEIKHAQEGGYVGYPVFTRKTLTDVCYLACARFMFDSIDVFYPQFATHNAQSAASIMVMAEGVGTDSYEYQRLQGMCTPLHSALISGLSFDDMSDLDQDLISDLDDISFSGVSCRIYAPVGGYDDLLSYLSRRLLENGANSSFIHRLADDSLPEDMIVSDPVIRASSYKQASNPLIVRPSEIFSPRRNSSGIPLWDRTHRLTLVKEIEDFFSSSSFFSAPLVKGGLRRGGGVRSVYAPHDFSRMIGEVCDGTPSLIEEAGHSARLAQEEWNSLGGDARGQILERAADLYEESRGLLMGLSILEAGKTLSNAQGELREAVDFLRYYASCARTDFTSAQSLAGVTGERNELCYHGRGVFGCISPWNFPLAIFTGQVSAALAAGNGVIAKPAEQTSLLAFEAVKLLHRAGVPEDILHFIPGDGGTIGSPLISCSYLDGVAFTGSEETARKIYRGLALRDGALLPLIAETGGMNAMIVDSSALLEQAVGDILFSAFDSAGQRCSAARLLFVQEDIYGRFVEMLVGAAGELRMGDPFNYSTDIGPVIDRGAMDMLNAYKSRISGSLKVLFDLPIPSDLSDMGYFVSPAIYELSSLGDLPKREIFGPILHILPYARRDLISVCSALNSTGYGLTLGLHTRIESVVDEVRAHIRVGNMYVNRNQIGAVVGSQPFGGEGLSGTGPKAGGPHYLHAFGVERCFSMDCTASGGNADLLSMGSPYDS